MKKLPCRYWSEMTSKEFSRLDYEKLIAVLPVGAIEQHGPHLPVCVDTCILDGIIAHAAALLPDSLAVTFLPTIPIGKSNEHSRYPGTLSFSAETLLRMWLEIGDSIAASGVRKLLIFNSHGGQVSALDIVGRDLRVKHDMLVVTSSWFALGLPPGLFDDDEIRHGIHAGDIETSMMLKLAPGQVNKDEIACFSSLTQKLAENESLISLAPGGKLAWQAQDLNPLGACGDASKADPERGAKAIDFAAKKLIELLHDIDQFPLQQLNNKPAW